jgi:hypothetical protein
LAKEKRFQFDFFRGTEADFIPVTLKLSDFVLHPSSWGIPLLSLMRKTPPFFDICKKGGSVVSFNTPQHLETDCFTEDFLRALVA